MPLLPLPPGGAAISGGDLPVVDSSDVLKVFPDFLKSGDSAPVRDALIAAMVAMFLTYQDFAAFAAAQSDVLRATGIYLDGLLEDRGIKRQPGEIDDDYRARGLAFQAVVTPAAILAAVNAILAPVSNVQCQYFEAGLDRAFLGSDWIIFPILPAPHDRGKAFVGTTPQYVDRLYAYDVATNGAARANSDPGGMWLFSDCIGRYFVLRVPDLASLDRILQLAYSGALLSVDDTLPPELGGATPSTFPTPPVGSLSPNLGGQGLFLGNGSNTSGAEADGSVATFMYSSSTSSYQIYQLIANTVERLKGQSIRWMLYVDPNLTS